MTTMAIHGKRTTTTKKMTTKPSGRGRRKPAKPVGARALLLTLALGGALGGWAGLAISAARQEGSDPASVSQPDPALEAVVIVDAAVPDTLLLQLPPIPTVQPPPAALNATTSITSQTAPAPVSLAPIPAVPQPVIQHPVTRSRSSR